LNIAAVGNEGLRAWDRTDLSNAPLIWNYTGGDMRGVASKSTTTWFLGGRDTATEFYKFHFEVINAVQLTYATTGTGNFA
jgi:hypothetical protein